MARRRRSLREELEQVIVTIQLKQATPAVAVQALVAQTTTTPPDPALEPDTPADAKNSGDPVVRFQNAHAKSIDLRVREAFRVSESDFGVGNHVAFRREPDRVELENRNTGDRVWLEPDVFETIQQRHLIDEWPDGEFGF